MRIAMLAIDSRELLRRYGDPDPLFAPVVDVLTQSLAKTAGCEAHYVCCYKQPVRSPAALAENVYYHSLVVPPWGWLRGGYVGCVRAVRRKLREIKPDVVHGQGTERYCALAAVRSGFPNVVTVHGNMRLIAEATGAPLLSFIRLMAVLERFTLRRAGGVIAISTYTQQNLSGLARASWYVPNAVDTSYFAIQPRPISPPRLLCVANISKRKNQLQLIRALDPLAVQMKFELLFYGGLQDGDPYGKEFLSLLKTRPWCRFAGFAEPPVVQAALSESSLLVLPSLEDNCPMAVLEAMAAGVPVLAAKVGGVPDLIENGKTGLFCDPLDGDNIRAGVQRLLEEPPFARALAREAKKSALARFGPDIIARRHAEIYCEILQTNPRQTVH